MFKNLGDRLQLTLKKLSGQHKISEDNIKEALKEVKLALLEADVNYAVVKKFVNNVKEKANGVEVITGVNPREQFIKIINDELVEILGGKNTKLAKETSKATVVMLVGLQGAGKTTFAAKLSKLLKKNKEKPFLIGADVYRPAAKKQLEVLSNQIQVPFFSNFESNDAIEIVKEGLKKAREEKSTYILIDTAGRLHIDENLMQELKEIKVLSNPSEILLVVDAMTGQDAPNVAKVFNEKLDISGVVVTKLDGDTRGGADRKSVV